MSPGPELAAIPQPKPDPMLKDITDPDPKALPRSVA